MDQAVLSEQLFGVPWLGHVTVCVVHLTNAKRGALAQGGRTTALAAACMMHWQVVAGHGTMCFHHRHHGHHGVEDTLTLEQHLHGLILVAGGHVV